MPCHPVGNASWPCVTPYALSKYLYMVSEREGGKEGPSSCREQGRRDGIEERKRDAGAPVGSWRGQGRDDHAVYPALEGRDELGGVTRNLPGLMRGFLENPANEQAAMLSRRFASFSFSLFLALYRWRFSLFRCAFVCVSFCASFSGAWARLCASSAMRFT